MAGGYVNEEGRGQRERIKKRKLEIVARADNQAVHLSIALACQSSFWYRVTVTAP